MLKYNNTHIFTGYLKQLLSSFNLPTCKVYTHEFARHLESTGREDLRVLKSFDQYNANGKPTKTMRIGYLKDDNIFNYYGVKVTESNSFKCNWQRTSEVFYSAEKSIKGLTRTLVSAGSSYDTITHKYLGEYLRFIRDYYNVNLMSMYNCFSDEICYINNTNISVPEKESPTKLIINSSNTNYKIYRIPVKLFADYTIALECPSSIEIFCGLYNSMLDTSEALGEKIIQKTYKKITNTLFSQPFLYNKLNVKFWQKKVGSNPINELEDICWDITAREQDLYLFIKIPATCRSSIVVLEGDYREYNSSCYKADRKEYTYVSANVPQTIGTIAETPVAEVYAKTVWSYNQNRAILNFSNANDLNNCVFKPISKLQLLAFNTGESYPFADRLIEYLIGSAITSMDDIHDNIIRAQRVMSQNNNFFVIEGLWEEKMQNILYDYMMNSGPIEVKTLAFGADKTDSENYGKIIDPETYEYNYVEKPILIDTHEGYHRQLGHANKSLLFDILGYVDKDTEMAYACYTKKPNKQDKLVASVGNTIQNVDIYNGLYDI